MDIAMKIKKCRENAGLTQEELADKLGVTRPAIGRWESGATKPRTTNLNMLAAALNVTVLVYLVTPVEVSSVSTA